jgi:uncharacterized protein (TIGR04255 family)
MGEKLETPPLIEAVCEFRFTGKTNWDWIIPGQLYDRVKSEFPERAQISGVGFHIQASPKKNPVASVQNLPDRVQFKRADGSAIVQVGYNLLAINILRPYPNWTEFLTIIINIFNEYHSIAGTIELERIGLRYINQLSISAEFSEIGKMITLTPPLTGKLARPIHSFYQRYELEQDNPEGLLINQTGTQKDDKGNPVIVLDLDFGSTKVRRLKSATQVKTWLERAHNCIYDAFVSSLTPKLYAKFRGILDV